MPAGTDQTAKQFYEFGPFRVDPEKELLLRGEEAVPLTPKTFQILLVLVRRSKEVITKDDLLKSVWPDTFVEEANLSRNIFLLRKALGETPQDHQYIVTVPGRGYRFAEDVRLVPEQELSIVAASHTVVQVDVKETEPWVWMAVAAVVLVAVSVGVFRFFPRRPPVLTNRDTVVLADFSNSAGDSVFDETLRRGLAIQLEQSPYMSLISDQRVSKALGLMGRRPDVTLTPEIARQLCERTNSTAVVEGSIRMLGANYVLELRATNCANGDILDEEQSEVAKKEDVLKALGGIATNLRRRFGESLASVEKYSTPLDEATTPSLEALKAYSTGLKVGFSEGFEAGIPLFKRAIDIDPNFAMAHAHLGLWYSSVGESELARESTIRAYELRAQTSDREKFFITAMYYRDAIGNLEAAHQTLELWAETYPRDTYVHGLLSGFISQGTGRYQQSIQQAKQLLVLDPDFTPGYINLGFSNFYLDHLGEAKVAVDQALGRKLNIPEILLLNFYLAFFDNDEKGISQAVALAKDVPGAEDWMTYSQALVLARSGRLRLAKERTSRAMELTRQSGQQERAATYLAGEAVWEAMLGNASAAKNDANASLKLSQGRDVEYVAAFALALAGDYSRPRAMANDLAKRFPEDTSVQFNYLPALRGLLALKTGSPAGAVETLKAAVPYELGVPPIEFNTFFGAFYPVWVRGEAYLAEHQGTAAAAEFQKIIEHRGLVAGDPLGGLALLQLGRAYAMAGEKGKARASYQNFLDLWKDADLDIPILKQAKAEVGGLE